MNPRTQGAKNEWRNQRSLSCCGRWVNGCHGGCVINSLWQVGRQLDGMSVTATGEEVRRKVSLTSPMLIMTQKLEEQIRDGHDDYTFHPPNDA